MKQKTFIVQMRIYEDDFITNHLLTDEMTVRLINSNIEYHPEIEFKVFDCSEFGVIRELDYRCNSGLVEILDGDKVVYKEQL